MDHAVIIHLRLDDDAFGSPEVREALGELQDDLAEVIEEAEAGEFDGDEFGEGECVMYMYGPNADVLFDTVRPLLLKSPHSKGGYAIKRYGEASDPKAKEVKVSL